MRSYGSGATQHILETNSSSDEVYLSKVNKLTKALSRRKALCCHRGSRCLPEELLQGKTEKKERTCNKTQQEDNIFIN